ncbi:hypothetical protein HRI_000813700 [Hibiscus trionum]|uniref:Endonuclease/exonuclease/phosphatase domain-containing protein n=1 Tax=Hibiscus trionum TaxID=183268 RepID=A0A9W7H5K7_HIBTR|nr:hypothetical protein HRI_000813700 [Hibiscus trionum]
MELSIISWNIRGLGKLEKLVAIRRLVLQEKPKILFIQETKLNNFTPVILRGLRCFQKFEKIFSPAVGSSGGLLTIWDPEFFTVTESLSFRRFIAIIGHFRGGQFMCGLVNVYGPSTDTEKLDFFREVLEFLRNHRVAWCLGGDFNAYISCEEKIGSAFNLANMELFRAFISEANLIDLPLKGGGFAWSNNKEVATFVRLDKFLVDDNFLVNFHELNQNLLPKSISDHNAISLVNKGSAWGPKPFKLFNYLMELDGFEEVVVESLKQQKQRNNRLGILSLLKGTKSAIRVWTGKRNILQNGVIPQLEAKIF